MAEGQSNNINIDRIDIEQLLENDNIIRIKPKGYSMYPLLVAGRDEAIIKRAKPSELKRGDVVLYRRDGDILVLHRIFKVKADGFYMVGDNQVEPEGPLRADQIKGVMISFIRRGRQISVRNPMYILLSRIWLSIRPIRHILAVGVHWFLKKIGRR